MPRYLTEKEVLLINAAVIKKYSPNEQAGVKDIGLLQSALGRPQQSAFEEDAYASLWLKAAALYASLTQNHAFHNANKRTGFAAMKQFVWLNGYKFSANQKVAEDYTVYVVEAKPSMEEIAKWIQTSANKR